MAKLTLKQELFVYLYLKTRNGTESAYRVYKCKNRNVASQIAHENLRKPKIFNWIRSTLTANGLSVETALKTLMEIAGEKNIVNIRASDKLRATELLLRLENYL